MASQDWFDKDFYKTLGVSKDVSDADLKKTYRKLARKYHPDSNQGDAAAEAKFKEVSEAYSVLSDADQRKEYDEIRAMGSGARFTSGGAGATGGFEDVFSRFGQRGQSTADFEDIFAMFNQGQGQGGSFGSGRFGQTSGGFRGFGGPQRGADVTARTTIDFATAAQGETITLQGEDGKPFKVKIPAGVADGQKIRLRGRGRPSPDGGESGDIVVSITVRQHPVFTRDGLNLRVTVPVTFTEAALGATIEVPALGGDVVKLRVAPGTPSGRVLRVKGRGIASSKGTGDLLAELQVAVPSHLDDTAREALLAFQAAEPKENPRGDLFACSRVRGEAAMTPDDEDAPVFAIAVAAELASMHPQTLRQYDRIGLVVPGRTRGGSRRYSPRNVQQLREVARLSGEGMSLPAIARLLDLEDEVRMLRRRVLDLEGALRLERENRPGVRVFAAGAGGVIPVPSGRRIRRSTEVVLWRPGMRRDDSDD